MNNHALIYRQFGHPEATLRYEVAPLIAREPSMLRVKMHFAPVNASDLIPITGAYGHRVVPPQVAGYEGVGVVTQAPDAWADLIGRRVLPLRGQGTWQSWVECAPSQAIPVPDTVADPVAARAYINPLAALLMLKRYPPVGKRVLLTAAGSDCALLLGQWALRLGAISVVGIHRSAVHAQTLSDCGIIPVRQDDSATVGHYASCADLVFDATGGALAESILQRLPEAAHFVCYGLLSGQPFRQQRRFPTIHWFHIRNALKEMDDSQWQGLFDEIWPLLAVSFLSDTVTWPFAQWQQALACYRTPGRRVKPLLAF